MFPTSSRRRNMPPGGQTTARSLPPGHAAGTVRAEVARVDRCIEMCAQRMVVLLDLHDGGADASRDGDADAVGVRGRAPAPAAETRRLSELIGQRFELSA